MQMKIECTACNATGLYKGFAERGSSAVVCNKCSGTGCRIVALEPFIERRTRNDVKRVYDASYGFALTDEDVQAEDGRTIHFSRYGCTYEEWLKGATPHVVRDLVCPYQFVGLAYGREPLTRCEALKWGHHVTSCPHRNDICECWRLFDGQEAHGAMGTDFRRSTLPISMPKEE